MKLAKRGISASGADEKYQYAKQVLEELADLKLQLFMIGGTLIGAERHKGLCLGMTM